MTRPTRAEFVQRWREPHADLSETGELLANAIYGGAEDKPIAHRDPKPENVLDPAPCAAAHRARLDAEDRALNAEALARTNEAERDNFIKEWQFTRTKLETAERERDEARARIMAVAAEEREACWRACVLVRARCEESGGAWRTVSNCIAAIRARGTKPVAT